MEANRAQDIEIPASVAQQLVEGACSEPFRWLGAHRTPGGWTVTAFVPGAEDLTVLDAQLRLPQAKLDRVDGRGLFTGIVPDKLGREGYRLRAVRVMRNGPLTIPIALARFWVNWTNICWPKALIWSFGTN